MSLFSAASHRAAELQRATIVIRSILIAVLFFIFVAGYFTGKGVADRWYAKHPPQISIGAECTYDGNVVTCSIRRQKGK